MPTDAQQPEPVSSSTGAEDDAALQAALETVPSGAFALAGLAVSLLLLAWLFVYFCVFLPRGPVS
jgi:hypothetical protein